MLLPAVLFLLIVSMRCALVPDNGAESPVGVFRKTLLSDQNKGCIEELKTGLRYSHPHLNFEDLFRGLNRFLLGGHQLTSFRATSHYVIDDQGALLCQIVLQTPQEVARFTLSDQSPAVLKFSYSQNGESVVITESKCGDVNPSN